MNSPVEGSTNNERQKRRARFRKSHLMNSLRREKFKAQTHVRSRQMSPKNALDVHECESWPVDVELDDRLVGAEVTDGVSVVDGSQQPKNIPGVSHVDDVTWGVDWLNDFVAV